VATSVTFVAGPRWFLYYWIRCVATPTKPVTPIRLKTKHVKRNKYYSAGTAVTQAAGAGSFGIHVTIPEADPELESILDMVAFSVIFTNP
jgi:hypothetical protein